MPTYDVVVAGLGGFGSSAAAHLARRGLRVLGLDPRPGAHSEGSSHGESRIVRQVYFEGASYVPMLLRTYELWAGLSRQDGSPVMRTTGALYLGAPGTRVLAGSIETAREWGLGHEVLEAADVTKRFPALHPSVGTLGLFEPAGGLVEPEAAVAAQLRAATAAGAELRHDEAVVGWRATGDGVTVTTTRGEVSAGALVLAPGTWAPRLLGGLDLPLSVERRVQHWFEPRDVTDFSPDRLPVWIWDLADGTSLYGVPSLAAGLVKTAVHFCTERPADAWTPDEVASVLSGLLPGLGADHRRAAECWYTLTPDHHFVIGRHPVSDRVLLACGFSGHGFKFTPVVGEVLADLVVDGSTRFDLALFDPLRFG
ncbi:MAG TPA: N-methyl-L-tryptophan oxidase [Actinomycetes bacterium]